MIYSVFHFNLFFSSLHVSDRHTVINECYWPLINMIDRNNFKISLEIPGSTINEIKDIDPKLLIKIKDLISQGKVDIIASGYLQMIWQLVPKNILEENMLLSQLVTLRLTGYIFLKIHE